VPELPDLTVYVEALRARVVGTRLEGVRLGNPFLLRTVDPPLDRAFGRTVESIGLLGKRIVYAENEANYCAKCQTGGRLLADRALSRLLRDDWPQRLEDVAD
jgi:hypothetical protein